MNNPASEPVRVELQPMYSQIPDLGLKIGFLTGLVAFLGSSLLMPPSQRAW